MTSKQINFTIVPDEPGDPERTRREYANFCAVAHTPFDLTLTFCDVRPLSERDVQAAETSQTVRVPIVARIALPFGVVPGLIAALQEQLRAVQEAQTTQDPNPWPKGSLH
ncbi:MAG: DUF3467 domain-containing protein [Vicinamibacterales bacterium]